MDGGAEDAEIARQVQAMLEAPLTADAAVGVALFNNRSLQAIYEELGLARAEVMRAATLSNPVFHLSPRFPEGSRSGTNTELAVAWSFLDALMIPARRRIAEAQFDESRLRVAHAVLDLAAESRAAFYEHQAAARFAAVMRTILEAADAAHELALRMHEAGNLSERALANERAMLEAARIEAGRAGLDERLARERLNARMGLWGEATRWSAPESLPPLPVADPDPAQWEPIAVAQRLDLAAAGKEWQALADALGVARDWRFLLAADVGASAERELDGVWVFGPSLGFELPIFNRRGAEIAALQSELRRAEHRLTALAVEIRGEVRSARSRMAFAREAAESYRDTLVPLRERVVALTQEAYNFMLVGQFELLQAKREEIEAYRGYVGAVRDYWIARTDLERAVGGRLDAEPTPASSFIAPTAATPTQPHVHHPPKENRP